MKFKRYIKKVYQIAGLEWVDDTGINDEDGILFNALNITNDTSRRTIDDRQKIISWANIIKRIGDSIITSNIINTQGTGIELFSIETSPENKISFDFKSLIGGESIMLLDDSQEIEISTTYEARGAIKIPRKYTAERPGDPIPGETYFSRNTGKVTVWDGDEWKTLRYD